MPLIRYLSCCLDAPRQLRKMAAIYSLDCSAIVCLKIAHRSFWCDRRFTISVRTRQVHASPTVPELFDRAQSELADGWIPTVILRFVFMQGFLTVLHKYYSQILQKPHDLFVSKPRAKIQRSHSLLSGLKLWRTGFPWSSAAEQTCRFSTGATSRRYTTTLWFLFKSDCLKDCCRHVPALRTVEWRKSDGGTRIQRRGAALWTAFWLYSSWLMVFLLCLTNLQCVPDDQTFISCSKAAC